MYVDFSEIPFKKGEVSFSGITKRREDHDPNGHNYGMQLVGNTGQSIEWIQIQWKPEQ